MADPIIYRQLKKLFSSDVVVRNIGGRQLKVIDVDQIQKFGMSSQNDRFTRMYSTLNYRLSSQQALYGMESQRLRLFRDYEVMDTDAIIASALDIYSEECVGEKTIIPLLDGRKLSIKELFEKNEKDFWVYSIDKNGKFVPEQCEFVKYNGKKEMYKITFDDGTEIEASENHLWVGSDNTLIYTTDLLIGSGIKNIRTKISEGFIDGYEMLVEDKEWKYTHRLVGNRHKRLKENKKRFNASNKPVIHHKSYNKLNNSPDDLQWMSWNEHKEYHAKNNAERWKMDQKYNKKMRSIFSDNAKQMHKNPEFVKKFREGQLNWFKSLSIENKKTIFGRNDKQNGMYGSHRIKNSNPNWNEDVQRIDDINLDNYLLDLEQGLTREQLSEKYNLLFHDVITMNRLICDKYEIKSIKNIKLKNMTLSILRKEIEILNEQGINPKRNINKIGKKYNLTTGELINFIKKHNYRNFTDLIDSNNHRIINIEYVGKKDAYDLVNVGNSHIYAIEANDGSKLYCHNSTMKNEMGEILRVRAGTHKVREVLENLFYDILNIEFNLPTWVRGMCKYGDYLLKLELAEKYGITNVMPLPVYEVKRVEGEDPAKPNIVKFYLEGGGGKTAMENFEVAHFRLLTDSNWLPYGKSMVEPARRVWKQLILMEDAMLIHRIMRAPERRIFKIDVGNIAPHEVDPYMKRIISQVKKVPYIDPDTGDYNLKFNMQNMTEDFYLPVRGGDSGTNIENIGGLEYNAIEDIEYLRNKMMAALKIPKAFLGYEEQVGCVVPETKIPLLNGKIKTIKELIKDYENGIKNYVYSINEETKNIVPGEISWAGYTRKNAKLVRVHLDNGKYIDSTPDHKYLTRDGIWTEAQNLKNDESLMPLYLNNTVQKNKQGYATVYQPSTGKYEEVHRIVAEHYGLVYRGSGRVVHHVDLDKKNNYPNNFDCSMNFWQHRKFHQKLISETMNSFENIQRRINDPNWIKSSIEGGRKGGIKSGKKLGKWVKENGTWNKGLLSGEYKYCVSCGVKFYVEPNKINKKCCSIKCSDKYYIGDKRYNTKYNIEYSLLLNTAKKSVSFADLEIKLGNIDRNTLNRIFEYHDIDKIDFIFNNMPLAINNKNFMQNYRKYESQYINHKVVKVEFLEEQRDTCDITINKYHNFATSAGIIIHNSKATLASEDVRFARTIEKIQKIIVSELYKIGLIHLYIQGFKGNDLVDFDLNLTTPSIIYEQEKIELWNSKISLARDIKDIKMLSQKWIYKNVLNMTDDDIIEEEKGVIEDQKNQYRLEQIEQEGNDPAETKQGFTDGQPNENFNLKDNDEEYKPVNPSEDGRRGDNIRTRDKDEPFGEDPIGKKDYDKILKLDKDLNYDANKKKHLSRKIKRAESIFGKKVGSKRVLSENDLLTLKNYFNVIDEKGNNININKEINKENKEKNSENN